MKKILAIAVTALSLAACDNAEKNTETVTTDSASETSTTSTAYSATDGDVMYREKKVMVMKNGAWVDADEDVKLDNGVVVYRDGRVTRDDLEIELQDGEIINRTGNFFDRSGVAIENAWEETKEGATNAGRAIKNTAKKLGNKIDSAIDKDDKNDN